MDDLESLVKFANNKNIANYMTKINNMQLDECTTSRIKGLKQIYGDMVKYLNTVNNSV